MVTNSGVGDRLKIFFFGEDSFTTLGPDDNNIIQRFYDSITLPNQYVTEYTIST